MSIGYQRIAVIGGNSLMEAIAKRFSQPKEVAPPIAVQKEQDMFGISMMGFPYPIFQGPSFEGYVNYRISKSRRATRGARAASQRSRSRRRR